MNDYAKPAEGFAPGEYLQDEIDARGWSQLDLAAILGMTPVHVNDLIKGRRPFTPEIAKALGAAFGTTAQYWLNLQSAYQLSTASKADDEISRRAEVFGKYPVRDLVKRTWIVDSSNISVIETRICEFYGIQHINEEIRIPHAARMSTEYGRETAMHAAWFARLKALAPLVSVSSRYSKRKFDNTISDLKRLCEDPNDIRLVPSTLAKYGIRFVIIEHLPGTKLDGGCIWLPDDSPAIGLSLRYGRMDHFWFILFHEMFHIGNGDKDCIGVSLYEDSEHGPQKPPQERRADLAASDALIKREFFEDFVNRKGGIYKTEEIIGFSIDNHIHPAILVGQIHHRDKNYNKFNKLMVQIRSIITETALTDGWGVALPI